MKEIFNDTEYTYKELQELQWHKVSEYTSNYSTLTVTEYVNQDNTIGKKVYSDGCEDYYEIG